MPSKYKIEFSRMGYLRSHRHGTRLFPLFSVKQLVGEQWFVLAEDLHSDKAIEVVESIIKTEREYVLVPRGIILN